MRLLHDGDADLAGADLLGQLHRAHHILEHLGLRPLLDFDLRLGEGTGAALAMPILDASLKVLNEMATFQSAAVSTKSEKT